MAKKNTTRPAAAVATGTASAPTTPSAATPPANAPELSASAVQPQAATPIGQDDIVIETPAAADPAAATQATADADESTAAPAASTEATDGPAGTEARGADGEDPAGDAGDDDGEDEDDDDRPQDDAAATPSVPLTESRHWQQVLARMKRPTAVPGYCKRSGFTLSPENALRVNEVWGAMLAAGVTFPDGERVTTPDDALEALIELTHTYLTDLA